METSGPRAIFGMLDGFKPITNLLGAGDPNVHKIDDQWWMFFGGFQKTLKNNLFSATLPKGEPLHNGMTWEITADPGRPHKALALVDQPDKGEWDHYGLHEPCFVDGLTASPEGQQVRCRRIYYAGRSSRRVLGNDAPYSIGFLESTSAGWWRHGEPVVVGDARNPSALGPKVLYADGKWRMWFRAAPQEPAKGDRPIAEIRYTESDDGVRGWTEPTSFSSREDGFAHAFTSRSTDSYEMLLSKSPNLFGESFYPPQKLWLSTSKRPSGDAAEWTTPAPILEASDGEDWYRGGFFGSSICDADSTAERERTRRYVFFTGVHSPINWPAYAARSLASFRRPPVPAPFQFTIGFFSLDLHGS